MKNSTLWIGGKATIWGAVLVAAATLSSCIKNNDSNYVEQPAALVSVVNASPDSQPVNFYLDQNLANSYTIPYGNGQDYVKAYTGKRTAKFVVASSSATIKSDTITLVANKIYTAYLANLSATPDIIFIRDSVAKPAAGMASVRLVNVSANAPAVSLVVRGGATLATNRPYKTASPFVTVQGGNTYTFDVVQNGTSNVIATLADAKLNPNSVYTVWLQGVNGATDATKVAAKLQNNAFFY